LIWVSRSIPDSWKHSVIVPILKSGKDLPDLLFQAAIDQLRLPLISAS